MGRANPLAFVVALAMAALPCAPAAAQPPAKPQRIVSLNLCADELLLLLVPRARIASLSHLSHEPESAPLGLEALARSIPANHGLAEEVLAYKPDLVIAGLYAARPAVNMLRKLGYRVVDFSPEENFDDMRRSIRDIGALVGEAARAEALIASFDVRFSAITGNLGPARPIYADIGVNNWMPGRNTLPTAIANAAGFRTLGETLGYEGFRSLPLEQLAVQKPDLMSNTTAYAGHPSMATNALRHPALRAMAARVEAVKIPERAWMCASPSALVAVEALVAKRAALGVR